MELIEREEFLNALRAEFQKIQTDQGHCMLIGGEAGIGKTALVKAFCEELKDNCCIYQGTCDALFSPRKLAPLYDIAWQLGSILPENIETKIDREDLFSTLFRDLESQSGPTLVIFEDIHWADEATLDFINFFSRRINRLSCLFIVTYCYDEIDLQHPLRNVLGQLSADSFTRLQLPPFSRHTVERLAEEKGYNGLDVYRISGGNPFYVSEIIAGGTTGVPDKVKDAVLSVFNRQREQTKRIWEILSVHPTGLGINCLEKISPYYATAIAQSLHAKILLIDQGLIFFRHELYRRAIETSLSPLVRIALNKQILYLMLETPVTGQEIAKLIHHAKNANEHEIIVKYAPLAAARAASLGAHIEASKLYYSAIEYYRGNDKDTLINLYEPYAYECYLTNLIKEAIIYQTRALVIRNAKEDLQGTGNSLRFLSRLWWFESNREKADYYGNEAIKALAGQPGSKAKALALSNISQLKMLSDEPAECISWAQMAMQVANELGDKEVLCHALNNIGAMQLRQQSGQDGIALLEQSLEIALKNSYHEHSARAYASLANSAVKMWDHATANKAIAGGIRYCQERDLNLWTVFIMADKARLLLQTGNWKEAEAIAEELISYEIQTPVVKVSALVVLGTIKMRQGHSETALPILLEANKKAWPAMELQWIIPVLNALLEFEWLSGRRIIEEDELNKAVEMTGRMGCFYQNSEFAFWLFKVRQRKPGLKDLYEGHQIADTAAARRAANLWKRLGCPYEQALALFEGDEADKRSGITIVHLLGATIVYEKMKLQMRMAGIKSIPRGIRKTSQANVAHLTDRELDVLQLLKEGLQNKEIAGRLFISAKTVDHHISAILLKLNVNSRIKAVHEAVQLNIIK